MKKTIKNKYFRISIFLLTLLFTFIIRAHNYDREPPFGHLEEHLYAWSGLYLIETGTPVSWSALDYPQRAEIFRGKIDFHGNPSEAFVRLYKPWLDEPPVFSLIVGLFAHIYHADKNFLIPSSYIRLPVVVFSTLTSIMVFLIADLISGYWIAILAMLLYGTIPTLVISSRLAVAENLIALLYMLMIYLLIKFKENPNFKWLLPIPIIVGLAGLSKPTGFFLTPLAIFFVLKEKYFKSSIYILAITALFFLAFIVYGVHYDSQIFWKIFSTQGFRPVGFSGLGWFFVSPAYDITTFIDTWYIFATLAGFFFVLVPNKSLKGVISLAFLYWLGVVLLTGGEQDLLPWYRYPAFPLLAILAAWGIEYIYKNLNILTSFIGVAMFMGSRHLLVNAFRENIYPSNFRLLFSSLIAPSILNELFPKKFFEKAAKIIIVGVIIVGTYFNVLYVYNQFEITCESQTCPFGPTTKLSTIHLPLIWKFFTLGNSDLH